MRVCAGKIKNAAGCIYLIEKTIRSKLGACSKFRQFSQCDVPDIVRVSIVAPIGNSDHSSHFDGSGCSKHVC